MRRKENNFTGFIAHYNNGTSIKEKENFFSKKLNKQCATNWAEINKEKLISMELYWKGEFKAKILKIPEKKDDVPYTILNPDQWFFSHSGYMDMNTRTIKVVSRNIGYVYNGIIYITSVNENVGNIRIHSRAQ